MEGPESRIFPFFTVPVRPSPDQPMPQQSLWSRSSCQEPNGDTQKSCGVKPHFSSLYV